MHWLNIETTKLRSPEFIGSEPVARATWLCVNAYCCEQENGGRIPGARAWRDRQWQQTCGVTLAEVEQSAPLVQWDGADLVVRYYPNDKEIQVQQKRTAGRKGGEAKTQAKTQAAQHNGVLGGRPITEEPSAETQAEQSLTEAETQARAPDNPSENPTEGKGREGNRNGKECEPRARQRPTLDQCKAAAVAAGVTPDDAETWWHAREGSGWMRGTAGSGVIPVGSNWHSDMKSYTNSARNRAAEQRQKGGGGNGANQHGNHANRNRGTANEGAASEYAAG